VRSLIGPASSITSALLYPSRTPGDPSQNVFAPLPDPEAVLTSLSDVLGQARDNLRAGLALPGIAAGARYDDTRNLKANHRAERDDLAFALPVVPGSVLEAKKLSAREKLGAIVAFWEEP
jgi:hypothetical protein